MMVKEDIHNKPILFLRIGTLGEKDLLRAISGSVAGVMVGANLVEAA